MVLPWTIRGAGAGPAGTAAAGPMLEAKLMNLIKGWLQKFWLSNNFSVKFTRSCASAASPDQSWYASDATDNRVIVYGCTHTAISLCLSPLITAALCSPNSSVGSSPSLLHMNVNNLCVWPLTPHPFSACNCGLGFLNQCLAYSGRHRVLFNLKSLI